MTTDLPSNFSSNAEAVQVSSSSSLKDRSLALDVFRGLTVALMLLVNNIALDTATPAPLLHAAWGAAITPADLVFPWFLFATGLSIPFAFSSLRRRIPGFAAWVWKALQRAFWLFVLGCIVTSAVDQHIEITLGVLQVIGLAFGVAAQLYPFPLIWRLSSIAMLLIGYWVVLRFLPVPGLPVGVFEENQNLVRFVNNTYLQPLGLRGLTSVIPTSALVLIAACIGDIVRQPKPIKLKIGLLLAIGSILTVIGLIWDIDLEMNKAVWTPSYIVYTAGLGTVLIAVLTYLETLRWKSWMFVFTVFGSNALIAYIAPILFKVWVLSNIRVHGQNSLTAWLEWLRNSTNPIMGGWLYTLIYLALTWLFLLVLYRRKLFLRV